MPAKRILTQDVVVAMYVSQHLTMQEIADLHGVTRAAVNKLLKRSRVNREQGTWIDVVCAFCGKQIRLVRSRWKRQIVAYCSTECHFAALENPGYKPWRHGTRLARAIVAQRFALESEHIVHHIDGDERNNNLDNLAVYASQSDHMAMHRGRKVTPIWP